jgi:large subunit ribosomal protein LP2
MKVIAAYILAVLGGNEAPDASAISKILESVGIDADKERVDKFLGEVAGKNVWDVIAEGSEKLAAAPVGGSAAAGSSGAAAGGDAAAAEEEKKDESDEESDAEMGFDLFGGGDGGDDAY